MTLLYNFGICCYYFLALLLAPFNKKINKWVKGRIGVFSYLNEQLANSKKTAWFHVSSLGEFEQGKPVIEAFRTKYPDYNIVLTFFSPSGYEIRKNYNGADAICYLPLDTRRNAKKFMKIVNPEFVFFVKYDYWFHFLKQAKKSGARLFLISGIFREKQAFFKWYGGWYKQILQWFEHFFVQNSESQSLLKSLQIQNVTVSGDTRFDRVAQIAENGKSIEIAEKFAAGHKTIVCGSTWPTDEELLIRYIVENKGIKLILAPHEINKPHIDAIIKQLNMPYTLYSEAKSEKLESARVLIIDNIGMLSSIYKYGQIAYIGGGFGVSIHNTLEAAVYGVPVLFGPKYHKFQEAKDLIASGGGTSISSYTELKENLDLFVQNPDKLRECSLASSQYVQRMQGATNTILNHLNPLSTG